MSATVPPLVDAVARELAAADLSTTYIVEAAAGTGKTTLLVSRILTIIRETLTPPAQIVAITFTEKAAAELKQRVREALEREAVGDGEGAERCAAALRDIDALSVSTIHSFCAELLRQRPVEAGVDPGFVVVDETTSDALIDEAWHEWLLTELNTDAPAAARFFGLGLPLSASNNAASLRSLFDTLWNHRDDLDGIRVAAPDLREMQDHLDQLAADTEAACARLQECRDPQDSLARQISAVCEWLARRPSNDLRAQWEWLAHPPPLDGRSKGRKDNWNADALAAARDFFLKRFEIVGAAAMRQIISYWAAPLIEWLKAGVGFVWRRLRDRGLLDFQDLLISARSMLRDSGPARDYFKQRYAYVLVDEFQDTDPLQAEIVFFLCENPAQQTANWRAAVLDHGKLFIVGDPKQSIYRFRRADLDMYGAVRALIEAQGRCLPIRVNFRSDAALISEVNAIFAPWMTGPTGGRYEPEYVAMEPHRTVATGAPRAILLPPPPGFDLQRDVADIAAAEAACIAEYIAEQRAAAAADFAYRDVGILYPASTHLERLEEALKARAIPYRVAGERALGTRIEITSLHTVLSAVDNPLDEMAVAGALRSLYFGCSDEELLTHRMGGGSFNYAGAEPDVPHLRTCFAVLRELHARRSAVPPSELIADLFAYTAGLHVFALKPRGERRIALLLRILDQARALEQAGSRSLTRFVHWLGRLDELPAMDDDFALAGEADALQLLTFHKAKGLEFPTVILFGIERNQQRRRRAELVDRNAGSVEFKFARLQTAGYEQAAANDKQRERAETARLLYVALTRARERLVLPLYWCKEITKTDQQWFLEVLAAHLPLTPDGSPDISRSGFVLHKTAHYTLNTRRDERLRLEPSAEDSGDSDARAQWQLQREQAAAALNREARFRRPSAHASAPPPAASKTASPFALTFGSFVHRALERIALPGGENSEAVLAEAAGEFAQPPEQIAEARDLIARVLNCPLLQARIAAAGRVFRELNFLLDANGVLTEGAMDLVLIEGDAATIVDYKTDALPADAVIARAESYRDQARDYAAALERIAGVRVAEVWLYFLRPDRIVRLPRDSLNSASSGF